MLAGAGNAATRMGQALKEAGVDIVQVFNRSEESAQHLAGFLQAGFTTNPGSVVPDADLYIIAVPDDAIAAVVKDINAQDKFVVHTSGSVSMEILAPFALNYGVLYPLQTFSKERTVDFSTIPVCIEASSLRNLELLSLLASKISSDIRSIPSAQRKALHLAAVFACNFPNFMYAVAESIVHRANLDFDLLKPLILETARKVQSISPARAQTGPAFRGDTQIMDDHLEMLKQDPAIRELYKRISEEIPRLKK